MKVIYKPRVSGKTIELLIWLNEDTNRVLITHSSQEAERLKNYLLENVPDGKDVNCNIFSYHEWISNKQYGNYNNLKIAIDNAELVLQSMFSHKIDIISLTKE